MSRDFYSASDYAGLRGGDYEFYYGYERTNDDWLFEAKHKGETILLVTAAQLGAQQFDDPQDVLMKGIAVVLDKFISA